MSLTPSNMLPLGTRASGFSLPDPVKGGEKSLDVLASDKATVVMFICNHCPYVKHIQTVLVDVAKTYIAKGVSFIAINSNDVANYSEDSPEKMKEVSERFGYPFPYLYDETQKVAKSYQAACTPDFYIFDRDLKLVYRGQFDDSRPGSGIPVIGGDLSSALDQLLKGALVDPDQKPSMGCNIKWK